MSRIQPEFFKLSPCSEHANRNAADGGPLVRLARLGSPRELGQQHLTGIVVTPRDLDPSVPDDASDLVHRHDIAVRRITGRRTVVNLSISST
jgi:hypothetical protein